MRAMEAAMDRFVKREDIKRFANFAGDAGTQR